ncbi:MAG: glycosyl hydrolase family 43, partial [Novosphingobium sp.]
MVRGKSRLARTIALAATAAAFSFSGVHASGQAQPAKVEVVPGAPETPYIDPDKAYLFAHMTKERYGVLYYSVSRDGLHWQQVNGGRPVSEDYHGHASIARGADGRYYLVGNKSDDDPYIRFWV